MSDDDADDETPRERPDRYTLHWNENLRPDDVKSGSDE